MTTEPQISDSEARRIAGEWHGGQWQPLYALASSGTVVHGAAAEVRSCLRIRPEHLPADFDRAELDALLAYCEANEPPDDD